MPVKWNFKFYIDQPLDGTCYKATKIRGRDENAKVIAKGLFT